MRPFSKQELADMQAAQTAHMMDRGFVWKHVKTDTVNSYGVNTVKYAPQAEIACGFQFAHKPSEVQDESDVAQIEAQLRLPYGTAVCSLDCFRVTERFGVADYTPQDYEIVGDPRMGPSGWLCDLARVTDGRFDKDC